MAPKEGEPKMRLRRHPHGPSASANARPTNPFQSITLEYPSTSDPNPRYGHGRPSHLGIEAMITAGAERYDSVLRSLAVHAEALGRFPTTRPGASEPQWIHEWLIGLDTISLYGFVRDRAPRMYVEVGSGESTKVVRQACSDAGSTTHIRSIDPAPRAEVDVLCDEVLRSPLETMPLERAFGDVAAGDIVFFDSTHRVLPGSDCVAFFLEVLPALPPGVLVGVHDVYLPDDYPPGFFELWWSEQYVLAASLLADAGRRYEIVLPCYWASGQPALAARLDPVWAQPATEGVNRRGSAFWFEVRG